MAKSGAIYLNSTVKGVSGFGEAQWRPCRIEAGRLKEVADWTEHYRHIGEQRLDRLDNYLQELQLKKEKSNARKSRRK